MYTIGFKFAENDVEMSLKIKDNFKDNTAVKSNPIDGMNTLIAIIQIAEFTIVFAEFVIEYIIRPIKGKKDLEQQESSNEHDFSVARCIVYNGKTITPSYILSKLNGKECTPENVLDILCKEFEIE